jgi:hypothetical protein
MNRSDAAYAHHVRFLKSAAKVPEPQIEDASIPLTRQRSEVKHFINPATPATTLPTEVLLEIFKAGHDSAFGNTSHFALLVSHVSSHWRNIALHSPFLWAAIQFGDGLLKSEDLLHCYLERSQKCLLSVRFDFYSHQDRYADCIHTLLQQTTRWRRLVVNATCTEAMMDLWTRLSTRTAPVLTSLEVDYGGEYVNELDHPPFTGAGAPVLTSITCRNLSLALALPLSPSLAHIQIGPDDNMSPWYESELGWVLRNAPSLKSLVFQHDVCIASASASHPISTHMRVPSLLSLEISCPLLSKGTHIGDLFVRIIAPNLQHLILDFPDSSMISEFIQSFRETPLSVKFPQLQTLGLHLHRVHDDLLAELCDALPGVTSILSTQGNGQTILELLDASNGHVHWRQLQSVSVSWVVQKSHLGLLCTVVSSRLMAGCPISQLQVDASFFHHATRDQILWLRERVELSMSE